MSKEINFNYELGTHKSEVEQTVTEMANQKISRRIWQKDFTVWSENPTEISNRLGWLDCTEVTKNSVVEIKKFSEQIRTEGFTDVLLLGMGGSSLAPEVFRKTFGKKEGFPDLHVLDSTHPDAVIEYSKKFNPDTTLYIVSTKSGGTVETMSFMKYFYTFAQNKLGKENVSQHFVAITDPGSGLQQIAEDLKFKKIFLNDPNIGGRYSALSLFGIVPAALLGVDIELLLNRASKTASESKDDKNMNTSSFLGAVMGALALKRVDKVTFILSPQISSFGTWAEQLIAESIGKIGKGILPVEGESLESPAHYSNDRLFVYIKLKNDSTFDKNYGELKAAGFPVINILWKDIYDLAGEFMRWEFATAIAGWKVGIQPFDQPNVESAKVLARQMMKVYGETGKLPELNPKVKEDSILIFTDLEVTNVKDAINKFLNNFDGGDDGKSRSYVSIHAYLKPESEIESSLQNLRTVIQNKYKLATTIGFGPRFLHSTGQLHKGDAGNGLFIQFTADYNEDAQIPDEAGSDNSSISFGVLINAQSLGDRQALLDNKRRVIRFDLGKDIIGGINKLIRILD
ncbi:MAG: glucose-6-phosphate isomerase [bacterium]